MGLRFFKRVNVVPGLRLNFSRSGISASLGHRGFWYTIGRRNRRITAGLPGTGLFYTQAVPWRRHRQDRYVLVDEPGLIERGMFVLALAVIIGLAWALAS